MSDQLPFPSAPETEHKDTLNRLPELEISIGGRSDKGLKPTNQDAFAAKIATGQDKQIKGIAAAISDGVSTAEQAHLASQTCVSSFIEDYYSSSPQWTVKQSASKVLSSLNSWMVSQNENAHAMKLLCTFIGMVCHGRHLHWFHVGDSRLYRLRNNQLEQLTRDHNSGDGRESLLTNAMGGTHRLEIDYDTFELELNDRYLLSTDGLHGSLSHSHIQKFLSQDEDLEELAKQIVAEAIASGSTDNVSALILQVNNLPTQSSEDIFQAWQKLPIPPALEIGNKIDQFTVTDLLYSGTRSYLYKVIDERDQQTYVLKAPPISYEDDQAYLSSFATEEWIGQKLQSSNIMKVLPQPQKKFLYNVYEWIDGCTLRQWMDDHPKASMTNIRPFIPQMISGLRAFQRAGMIHQDLKPENIIVKTDGTLKIIDFGTVKVTGIDETKNPVDSSTPLGSVGYVAPEYFFGEKGSFHSDLFSLACILYEMLVGELPYEMPKQTQRLKSYTSLVYRSALSQGTHLPVWIEASLKKALSPNPRDRYKALSEFEYDLKKPNLSLANKFQNTPLMQRNPVRAWKITTLIVLLVLVLENLWLFGR